MDKPKKFLDKYYNGDTSLEEEAFLKKELAGKKSIIAENDMFNYFLNEGVVPDNLEAEIGRAILQKDSGRKKLRKIYGYGSIAATAVIILTIGLIANKQKQQKMEEQFNMMEQAMYKMSQSVRPDEHEDMLVLWVDDNVEIILN